MSARKGRKLSVSPKQKANRSYDWNKYKKNYNPRWEEIYEFKGWLTKGPNENLASCLFCQKSIRAHKTDLTKHCSTSMHIRNAEYRKSISKLMQKNNINLDEGLYEFKLNLV